jgi:hypothetical protein
MGDDSTFLTRGLNTQLSRLQTPRRDVSELAQQLCSSTNGRAVTRVMPAGVFKIQTAAATPFLGPV